MSFNFLHIQIFIYLLYHIYAAGSAFLVPSEFCDGLPQGKFCNVNFPREILACPSSVSIICPVNYVCREGPLQNNGTYTASCFRELSSPAVAKCANVPQGQILSRCLDSQNIIECPQLNEYSCPGDMKCQRRGLRAFCVKPSFVAVTTVDSCSGFSEPQEDQPVICDAINLRKIVDCSTGKAKICSAGQICGVLENGDAGCVPWTADLGRFCSNKPLYSTFCIPNDLYGRFIQCGSNPTIYQCPNEAPTCSQQLSITVRCG